MSKTQRRYKYISDYYDKISTGKIRAPKKILATYKHVIEKVLVSEQFEYRSDLAKFAIDFVENYCRHSKGKLGGQLFKLESWQKGLLAIIFGVVYKKTTERKYKRAVLMMGRKNGKSTLSAAVGLYLLIADSEPGPEVYAVATKMDQAKIIWGEAVRMLKKSPDLYALAKPRVAEIVTRYTEGVFKPLGSDSKTLDGLNVHGALLDEIEAWVDMELYDVIVDGTAARDNYLIFITTTAGNIKSEVFDRLYNDAEQEINAYQRGEELDDSSIYFIYELDEAKQWRTEKYWVLANPGLGTIKNKETLKRKVDNAKRNRDLVRNLLAKDFDVPSTHTSSWLDLHEIVNKDTFELLTEFPDSENGLEPRYAIGGLDLSEKNDLTCATALFRLPDDDTIYLKQMYWIPEDTLDQRLLTDKVPYLTWIDDGYVTVCPGNQVDYRMVLDWFKTVQNEYDLYFYRIGYDRWNAGYLTNEFKEYFGDTVIEEVAQGSKTLSSPMKQLGADLRSNNVNYGHNPVFEWCTSNVKIKPDNNNNIMPLKNNVAGVRIDGFVSALIAYTVYEKYRTQYLNAI